MSVYIKGMEMPQNCYDCPFGADVDIGVGVAHGCNLLKDFAQFADERHDDCPLIPVPDHGRLIDADALKENWCLTEFGNKVVEVVEIDGAPTIIPSVKEGEG